MRASWYWLLPPFPEDTVSIMYTVSLLKANAVAYVFPIGHHIHSRSQIDRYKLLHHWQRKLEAEIRRAQGAFPFFYHTVIFILRKIMKQRAICREGNEFTHMNLRPITIRTANPPMGMRIQLYPFSESTHLFFIQPFPPQTRYCNSVIFQ